jgi:hypothetical protein
MINYIGIDQYGKTYPIEKHPRLELLKALGRSKAERMMVDDMEGRSHHVGYVIAQLWIQIYSIKEWRGN